MLDLLDLVQLQDLRDPTVALHQLLLLADLGNLFSQGIEVDRDVVSAREDVGKQAEKKYQ